MSEHTLFFCLIYFPGTIQTMNFAVNGRHLADQDYTICMRQEEKMCSIAYEPCDENSFKIGPPVSSGEFLPILNTFTASPGGINCKLTKSMIKNVKRREECDTFMTYVY